MSKRGLALLLATLIAVPAAAQFRYGGTPRIPPPQIRPNYPGGYPGWRPGAPPIHVPVTPVAPRASVHSITQGPRLVGVTVPRPTAQRVTASVAPRAATVSARVGITPPIARAGATPGLGATLRSGPVGKTTSSSLARLVEKGAWVMVAERATAGSTEHVLVAKQARGLSAAQELRNVVGKPGTELPRVEKLQAQLATLLDATGDAGLVSLATECLAQRARMAGHADAATELAPGAGAGGRLRDLKKQVEDHSGPAPRPESPDPAPLPALVPEAPAGSARPAVRESALADLPTPKELAAAEALVAHHLDKYHDQGRARLTRAVVPTSTDSRREDERDEDRRLSPSERVLAQVMRRQGKDAAAIADVLQQLR